MKNFFTVILLSAVSILLFAVYYMSKSIIHKFKTLRLRERLRKKSYEDEKNYTRNYLRDLIKQLESGNLHWILINSRLHPEVKIEIIYDSVETDIKIQNRNLKVNEHKLKYLKELGMLGFITKRELNCFSMPVNSKIVTDIVYYILEELCDQQYAHNLKIVTSGGSA
jgi:hypothetical protein